MGSYNVNLNKPLLRRECVGKIVWILCFLLLGWPLICSCEETENDPFAERSVRIGFNFQSYSDFNRPLETALKYLGEEIGKKTKVPTTIFFYDDINIMRTDFERGQINLIGTTPWLIAQHFKRELLADGVRTAMDDVSPDHLLLLTRRGQGITELKDLQNKKLGLVDNYTITKIYLDNLLLKNLSKHYRQVFQKITYFERSQLLLLGLFFNKVDAIVIFNSSYDIATQMNPQIKEHLQILDSMPGVFWGSMYFHKNVDPAFREFVISNLIGLKEDVQGKQLLELLKGTQFVRSSLADLDTIDALNDEYKRSSRERK